MNSGLKVAAATTVAVGATTQPAAAFASSSGIAAVGAIAEPLALTFTTPSGFALAATAPALPYVLGCVAIVSVAYISDLAPCV